MVQTNDYHQMARDGYCLVVKGVAAVGQPHPLAS